MRQHVFQSQIAINCNFSCIPMHTRIPWMVPILAHLIDEDGNSLVGARQDQIDALLDKAAEQIPVTVPNIFKFWQSSRIEERSN